MNHCRSKTQKRHSNTSTCKHIVYALLYLISFCSKGLCQTFHLFAYTCSSTSPPSVAYSCVQGIRKTQQLNIADTRYTASVSHAAQAAALLNLTSIISIGTTYYHGEHFIMREENDSSVFSI
jgi:hypothetical protein